MNDALIALHYQNDICHPDGRIPFSLNRDTPEASSFLAASGKALLLAREAGWTVAHVHIAFAPDYSDLPRNARLFQKVETLGAVKRGSWGAGAFEGLEPRQDEIVVLHNCNSAFRRTDLESRLRQRDVTRVTIMGLATQFSVEHTVRDAADLGFFARVLSDCCASGDTQAHEASLRVLAMLAEITSSHVIAEKGSSGLEPGRQ